MKIFIGTTNLHKYDLMYSGSRIYLDLCVSYVITRLDVENLNVSKKRQNGAIRLMRGKKNPFIIYHIYYADITFEKYLRRTMANGI